MTIQECLRILELEAAPHQDHLRLVYRRLVKKWHPDQFAHQPAIRAQAEEQLKQINLAYATLKAHCNSPPPSGKPGKSPENKAPGSGRTASKKQDGSAFKTYPWSQWFKPKPRKSSPKNKKAHADPFFKEKPKPAASRKKSRFQRVLKETAGQVQDIPQRKTKGARPVVQRIHGKKSNKNLRIEGFRPVRPITPISRVPRVDRIEGSD